MMRGAMRISVNGNEIVLDAACSVRELLERLELGDRPCAVELNERVVPRAEHARKTLAEGDAVEIVTLVGGG